MNRSTYLEKVQMHGKPSKSRLKATEDENAVPMSVLVSIIRGRDFSDIVSSDAEPPTEKSEKEIQDEIQAIFRQITASVTFLPMLDGHYTFNVLVYADAKSDVPLEWGDSDAKEIKDGEKVQLRGFSTSNHRVDTLVSYKYDFENCSIKPPFF